MTACGTASDLEATLRLFCLLWVYKAVGTPYYDGSNMEVVIALVDMMALLSTCFADGI